MRTREWKLSINYKTILMLVVTLIIHNNQQVTRWCHLLINYVFWWKDSTCVGAVTMSKQSFLNLENLPIVPTFVLILKVTFHIIKEGFGYCWEIIYSYHSLPLHWNPSKASINVTFIKSPSALSPAQIKSLFFCILETCNLYVLLAFPSLCLIW